MSHDDKETILIVDDEEAIRVLLCECLQDHGYETQEACNGEEALAALSSRPFQLVLSDVRMPGMNGLELLGIIGEKHAEVGVLMLTACEDVSMAVSAMKMGALDYVLKPFRIEDIKGTVRKALDRKRREVNQKRYVLQLEEVVKDQTMELRHTFEHLQDASEITLEALVAALDAREHETQAHSKRVSDYTVHLAKVAGVDSKLMGDIARGAMLHDVGKIGVSDNILLKPGKLTEAEWVEMKKHPHIGYWILDGIESLRPASEIVLAHQEKFDGTGYPNGLKGEEINIGARIFSVMDCFDAMTSDRPYRKATHYDAAREEIIRCSGSQFDPEVVRCFQRVPPQTWLEIRRSVLEQKKRSRNGRS